MRKASRVAAVLAGVALCLWSGRRLPWFRPADPLQPRFAEHQTSQAGRGPARPMHFLDPRVQFIPAAAPADADAPMQLPYAVVTDEALGLPPDFAGPAPQKLPRAIPGRRIPELTLFSELDSPQLIHRAVPLPEANTLAHLAYQARRVGRLRVGSDRTLLFNPQILLVKFRPAARVAALRVEPMREWAASQLLRQRSDVQFVELDVFQRRQFLPNDPLVGNQWHHRVIGSFAAWANGLGQPSVRVAIVDTPFQMDHPDLAANTVGGWDVVANVPLNSSPGIVHSTLCAGLVAAVINNGLGVAGASNCQLLPLNINGAVSEMYNAIIWAADHQVRLVNISWSGANSDTLETAAYYLKTKAGGILAMAAIDGTGYLDYTNQPDIYCISMTDAADNFQQTQSGTYIDFAAPGYQVYSTTTGGAYAYGSGTSYATPLFCGVAAWLMSMNPLLGPDEVIGILQSTARDLGPPGPDPFYGWGRIDFGAAAAAVMASLPRLAGLQITNAQATISANFRPGLTYLLWRTPQLLPPAWTLVTNAIVRTNPNDITLTDPSRPANWGFYRLQAVAH